jgi:hypothetical protein
MMITLYSPTPRRKRRQRLNPDLAGAVGVALLAWALVGLVFLF